MKKQQSDWQDHATRLASLRGVRLTSKRARILALLQQQDRPLSAYQLVEQYATRYQEAVKPMSVYRMLDALMEAELVHRLDSTNTYVACHDDGHDCGDHGIQFLICDQCERVVERPISNTLLRSMTRDLQAVGFSSVRHQLELHGLCSSCTEQAR